MGDSVSTSLTRSRAPDACRAPAVFSVVCNNCGHTDRPSWGDCVADPPCGPLRDAVEEEAPLPGPPCPESCGARPGGSCGSAHWLGLCHQPFRRRLGRDVFSVSFVPSESACLPACASLSTVPAWGARESCVLTPGCRLSPHTLVRLILG